MNNRPDEFTLLAYLDGRLDKAGVEEVDAWIGSDPEARKLMAEHRAVWAALGEAFPTAVESSDSFRRATVERARTEPARVTPLGARRWVGAVAAGLMLALALWAWQGARRGSADSPFILDDQVRPIIGHLELLDHLDFLDRHGDDLDLATDYMILRSFEAERSTER